ncbi:hypothetical protein DBV15_08731 [Temnothorax longispinosus]|uniref:Uncharacterized protein n=1 Tax=Temnothorax longispinosus TaxID=300112 RepID=A0A4V3SB78_9HYME|nr:hypothetical protein DBV15_08731 [Temnothorax longispinosus]
MHIVVCSVAGVVGARNLTMECRKGRRKGGAPILGSLLLAWLLTNGCAVVARNIANGILRLFHMHFAYPNELAAHILNHSPNSTEIKW